MNTLTQTDHSAIVISTLKGMGFKARKVARGKVHVSLNRRISTTEVRAAIWLSELPLTDDDVYRERLSGWVIVKCKSYPPPPNPKPR